MTRAARNQSWVPRPDDDDYPTPPEAIVPLIRALDLTRISEPGYIWEPAAGSMNLVETMTRSGVPVRASSLCGTDDRPEPLDFLQASSIPFDGHCVGIVTNPPFRDSLEFVQKALDLEVGFVAMLLRTKWLEGRQRFTDLYSQRPPAEIYQFSNRLKFFSSAIPRGKQPGWSAQAFGWFVWRRGHRGEPVVRWIKTDDGRQGNLAAF